MVVSWFCFRWARGLEDCLRITFQRLQPEIRAKMCPTTCVAHQNDSSRKVLYGSSMIVFTVRILFFERHTHNVNQCHTQKYARQACRQPVLCIKTIYIYILYITDITRLSPTWSHHGKRSFLQSPWDKTFEGMRMLGKEWKHHLSCVLLRTSGYIASVRPLCCCCVTEICLVGYLHLDLIWCREGIVQRSCMYQVLLSLLVLDYRRCKRLLKT